MKRKNIIVLSIILLILFSIPVSILYAIKLTQKMDSYEVNSKQLEKKVLIASSASNFKTAVVEQVVNNLKNKEVYIRVIDLSELNEINYDHWDVILMINSCKADKVEKAVHQALTENSISEKVILMITSGRGDWSDSQYKIDTVTGASDMKNINSTAQKLIKKVDLLLEK